MAPMTMMARPLVDRENGSGAAEPRRPVSFTRLFMRLLLCSLAFMLAVLAASLVGTLSLFAGLESEPAYSLAFVSTAALGTMLAATFTLAPFAVLVVIAEAFALRSVIVFALAGAVMGVAGAWGVVEQPVMLEDRRLLIACAAGIVGGFVYWLVAGRSSGAYRERRFG